MAQLDPSGGHRSGLSGRVLLQGTRERLGRGGESTGASRTVLKKQTARRTLVGQCRSLCGLAKRLSDRDDSTQ